MDYSHINCHENFLFVNHIMYLKCEMFSHIQEWEAKDRYEKSTTGDPILNILDACWVDEGMVEAGKRMYEVVTERCLKDNPKERANIENVVKDINEIIGITNL